MRLNKAFLSIFGLVVLSSCVTIPNTMVCTAAGRLSVGAICAETLTAKTSDMTFDQYIAFLEPQPAISGLPERSGALCQSSDDWNKMKTALEQACRELGAACSNDTKASIANLSKNTPKPKRFN